MVRQKQQHSRPSQGVQKLLLGRIQKEGFSAEPLRTFLWLINAHEQLISFPKICQNVLNIILVASEHWGFSEADFHVEGISPILKWITDNTSILSEVMGEDFNRKPKHDSDHPVMSRGSRRHPLYTTLWNTCENDLLKDKFLLLQAQLLYSHTKAMFKSNNRNEYENYEGQEEWDGLVNSPYQACLAVRQLSLQSYSEVLSSLAVESEPVTFARSLNAIGHVTDIEILERITSLESFIQKSLEIRDWRTRKVAGRKGAGGGARVTGFIERDNYIGDVDDQDLNFGNQIQVSELNLAPERLKKLLDLDLCRDEFESEELILSSFEDSQATNGGYAATLSAQMRHIEMANQLLPWSYGYLSISEVADVLKKSSMWVQNTIKNTKRPKQADVDKLESVCLMRVMLFTSSSFERARQLLVLPTKLQNEDAALSILIDSSKKYLWKIRAIQPEYKTVKEVGDGTEKMRSDYFYVEDIANTHYYINLLRKLRQSADENIQLKSKQNYHLFRHRPEKLLANLKSLLNELDPTGRLTVSKLSRFMFGRMLRITNGDICAASMISGEEHVLAHVRLFYTMLPIVLLEKYYFEETQNVVILVKQISSTKNIQIDKPTNFNQNRFVGSRLCPTKNAVKAAVSNLHQAILEAANSKSLIEFHNLYTLITVWQFSFATACRAIDTPYLPISSIDKETGIAALSDKDDRTGYKTRLIWLPPAIITSMEMYDQYRISILKKFPDIPHEDYPVFLYEQGRKDQLKIKPVRPKSLLPIMSQFLKYPANFHRRFMRSELLERGCPIEVVDGWMGHWHAGEEPWAKYSSFSFLNHKEALNSYLTPILQEIGLLDSSNLSTSLQAKKMRMNTF